jgi:DNA-binding Lrp family transcriptional regulator
MPPEVDENKLRKLLAQKLPQREMAKRLNVPRTTLQRMMKALDAAPGIVKLTCPLVQLLPRMAYSPHEHTTHNQPV